MHNQKELVLTEHHFEDARGCHCQVIVCGVQARTLFHDIESAELNKVHYYGCLELHRVDDLDE